MASLIHRALAALALILAFGVYTQAQTSTYHLHKENSSTSGLFQLKTANPDGTTLAIQSANLKNLAPGEYQIKAFDTQSGVPNVSGVIPAGSTITFTLWMKKSSSSGVIYPRAKLRLNNGAGTLICTTTGSSALTSTLTAYTLSGTTSASVVMTTSDRFYLWVGVNVATKATSNTYGVLNVEGTLNGNYDSRVVIPTAIPPPSITSLSTTSAPVGTAVTIAGSNFGATQGSSTITFNGVTASPSSWSATSIVAQVPASATTGPVVATVNGQSSNALTFTVTPKINSLSPTSGPVGTSVTITGTTFGATQGSSTVTFNGASTTPTSWSASSITTPVPSGASSGPVVVTVNGQASSGITFTVVTTGTVSGTVVNAEGTTPIAGATVKALQGTTTVTTVTTNGAGNYTLAELNAGTYTVEASAPGYGTKSRSLVTVTAGETTAVNLNLETIVSGPMSYIYDPLGRLVSTVGPTDTVIYSYDAVGNLLSISRQSSNQVSVINFTPAGGQIGSSVTIHGAGFSATASQNTVQFNGTVAAVTSATATRIVAVVPPGATTGPITVLSPNGSASSGTSFAVGEGSGAPAISSFSPTIGAPGDAITISGSNFQTIPMHNNVKFSNVRAQVTTAAPTSIVAKVSAIVSGKISVTTPYGSAIAGGDFFVPPPPRTAADVEYTARMTIGQSLTPVINTANKIAMVLFDGVAGQRISINLGPSTISYGYVDFYRPDGSALLQSQTLVSWANQKFIEPFLLPATGIYTIVVRGDGTTTGGTPISLYEVPPDLSGSITVGGAAQPVSNTTPGQNASLTFAGTQGQGISLVTTGSSITGSVTIKKPDGSDLASAFFNPPGLGPEAFIDKQTLPVTGTYTVLVNPGAAATGTTNVRLYDATDSIGPIVAGGSPVTVNMGTPGQNAQLTFEGSAGQRVSLNFSSAGIAYDVYLKKPDGTSIVQRFINSGWNGDFIDALTLDTTGPHTILIDPWGSYTGSVTVTLYNVPADVSASLTIGGAGTPIAIAAPGQNASFTFAGTAGQKVSLNITGVTVGFSTAYLRKPDGTDLAVANVSPPSGFVDTLTLPLSGTYSIFIDPAGNNTGNMTLTLYDASDVTSTIQVGGAPVTATVATPGQAILLTFDGLANQQLTVAWSNNTMGSLFFKLFRPDGTVHTSLSTGASNYAFGPPPLTIAGTYTIVIDPDLAGTGSITVSLTSP